MSFGRRKIPKHLIIEDEFSHSKSRSLSWVIMALIILVGSMAFSLAAKAEAKTHASLTNYHQGSLIAQTPFGFYRELTHLHSAYQALDNGMTKTMTLQQSFINSSQKIQKKAVYLIALPNFIELTLFEITRASFQTEANTPSELTSQKRSYRINPKIEESEFKKRKTLAENISDILPGEIISITLHFDHSEKVYF